MGNEAATIVQAVKTLGEHIEGRLDGFGDRLDGVDRRMEVMEKTLSGTREEQAVERGRDTNVRLNDHELRMRKLENFKFWLMGVGAVAGAAAAKIIDWIKH